MRREAGIALLLLAAVVTSACASGGRADRRSGSSFTPRGELLLVTGPDGEEMATYRLPSGPEQALALPDGVDVYQAPTWGPGGFAYLFAQIRPTDRSSQLYRLKPGGAPEAIGQRLDGTRAFTANGDVALSFSGCDSPIYAIELDASARWREIGRGCGGLPSPDGTQVALLDRTGLFMEPLHGDARERRLVSLGDLDALREHHIRPRPFVGEITWTAAGIAFLAGTYDNEGLIVRSSSGRVTVLPLGGQLVGLKWQPGGDLLAFSVGALLGPIATGNGEVRILDPNTGRLTLVAITDGFGQFAWAPDGRSLAVSKAADTTTIVDLEGHELTRLRVDGSIGGWRA